MGGIRSGAGEGNRTLVISLEGFCSTIELHPPVPEPRNTTSNSDSPKNIRLRSAVPHYCLVARVPGGGGWIRTNVGARPTDLQSAPFSRSGTPPAEPEIILSFPTLGQLKANRKRHGQAEFWSWPLTLNSPEKHDPAAEDGTQPHLQRLYYGIGILIGIKI